MTVKLETIDNSIENLIITGMIVDTEFLKEISRAALPEYFQSDISKIIVRWIRDYYFQNNQNSPGEEIKEIFELNQDELDEDEAVTVRIFLKRISEEYSGREFNAKYVLDKALLYLERNAYEYKIKLMTRELRRDNLEGVKEIFQSAGKEVFNQMTKWKSLSETSLLNSWWDLKKESIMTFPGDLGRYLPRIERGRLYAMLGPPKRGKSHWLLYWAYNGAFDGLNVVFFSLEMNEHEVDTRWKELISGKKIMDSSKQTFTIPVLDCKHNQKGDCNRPECLNNTGVSVFNGKLKESYLEHPNHVPCTFCKGKNDLFEPANWIIQEEITRLSKKEAIKTQKQFDEHVGYSKVRLLSFPIVSATVEDLENSLNELETHENFIPDLIVIDYADILKEDLRIGEKRHRVGDNWQKLSRMAKVRNAVVVTASQGNRQSATKNRIDVGDVSEDFSKIMTIDGIFAINECNFDQPNKWQIDRNWQIQRIETIALRYGKFVPGLQCITFNDLERSQICMDSYITW